MFWFGWLLKSHFRAGEETEAKSGVSSSGLPTPLCLCMDSSASFLAARAALPLGQEREPGRAVLYLEQVRRWNSFDIHEAGCPRLLLDSNHPKPQASHGLENRLVTEWGPKSTPVQGVHT